MKDYKQLYINELKNNRFGDALFFFTGGLIFFTILSSLILNLFTNIDNIFLNLVFGLIGGTLGFYYKFTEINIKIRKHETN